ncbi:MAG: flagellar basal body rod protein FlgC, partial [Acidimicrobiales bacterium]
MSLFGALGVSTTGMDTYQTWLNALGGNIANMNDTVRTNQPVYQAQYVVAQPLAAPAGSGGVGEGVGVAGVALGPSTGTLVYDPSNPLADSKGMVRQPTVDLGEQMVELIEAQNGYQASVSAFTQART